MAANNSIKVKQRGEKMNQSFSPIILNMKKTDYIIQQIKQKSKMPIENEFLFRIYIRQSLKNQKIITFYDWECPPRFLDKDKKSKVFINYCADLDKIFNNNNIDKFTEIPRVVKNKKQDNQILKFLKDLGIKFKLVKIIADTNAYYLTPESVNILGKQNVKNSFLEFKNRINQMLEKDYRIIRTKVYLFTELIAKYKKQYQHAFNQALKILNANKLNLISEKTWQEQLERIKSHIGLNDKTQIENFAKRIIASYAAEGIIFDLLSKGNILLNCVWLNTKEIDQRTIEITNCLRIKRKISKLPMLFLKH